MNSVHKHGELKVMISSQMRKTVAELLTDSRSTIKGIAKSLNLAPKTVRRIRDRIVGHQGRKGTFKPFLAEHSQEIYEMLQTCERRCPPLQRMIHEKLGVEVPIRTLERYCKALISKKESKEKPEEAPGRYESAPGQQMQIDFGEKVVPMGGVKTRIHVFVARMGYSRRIFAKAYPAETQSAWLDGIESAFRYFERLPLCLVCDNAASLVKNHNAHGQENRFTERFNQLCTYYAVLPIATAVRHPQSKGKVESAVKYVKINALVGIDKPDFDSLNVWLSAWCRATDMKPRDHFFDGPKTPALRWELERPKMRPCEKPPMFKIFEGERKVGKDGLIRIDNKYYKLPAELIGKEVGFQMDESKITVMQGAEVVGVFDKAADVFNPPEQVASTGNPAAEAEAKKVEELKKDSQWRAFNESTDALARDGSEYDEAVGWSKDKGNGKEGA